MKPEIYIPDYDNSILGIPNSIMKHYGIAPYHKTLPQLDKLLEKNYRNVVSIIFDGMGTDIINKHLDSGSFLQKYKIKDISSVFPCTTVAATKTIYSGRTPKEHGWVGWTCYFKEIDKYVELFKNTDYYTKEKLNIEKAENSDLAIETINEKIAWISNGDIKTHNVFPAKFSNGGITSVDDMVSKIAAITSGKEKNFIQAYWNEPDSTMHHKGCYHKDVRTLLKNIDKNIEKLSRLKDTIIIITADHGQIDIKEDIFLNEYPQIDECLVRYPSLERRSVGFYVKPDMKKTFEQRFNELFANDFILFEKEKYINDFLGAGKKHPRVEDFIGDYVAVAVTDKTFPYKPSFRKEVDLYKGHHAGLTPKEMIVPLVVIET